MKNNQHGGQMIAFRIPADALRELETVVKGIGLTTSTWARTAVLEALAMTRFPVQAGPGPAVEPVRDVPATPPRQSSWGLLSTQERSEEFGEWEKGGYKLPPGFELWPREGKLVWLDANWPIEKKSL